MVALTASQRNILTLRVLQGRSARSVSSKLGITEGNQRVLLYRARLALKTVLALPGICSASLRLLATDSAAAPLCEKILLDKNDLKENRQISASALHALDPDKMQERAPQIVLDTSDYDDIKATSLTAPLLRQRLRVLVRCSCHFCQSPHQ
jgi:sigma-70-like protein